MLSSQAFAWCYAAVTQGFLQSIVLPQHMDRLWFTLMMTVCHSAPVFMHEAFMLFIWYFHIFDDAMIQPLKNIDSALSWKCWKHSLLNHFVIIPLLLAFVAYPVFTFYTDVSSMVIPGTQIILQHIFLCIIIEDFLFYWSHRLLHHPMLYKHFHKKHHEFKVLTASSIASEYTHPVESLLGNIIPVMMGPLVTKCHFYTTCMWLILRMLKTCDAHSGYSFKWSPFGLFYPLNPAERHDFHHETGLGSYGSFFLLWDQWTGTDEAFLQSRHQQVKETPSSKKSKIAKKMK